MKEYDLTPNKFPLLKKQEIWIMQEAMQIKES